MDGSLEHAFPTPEPNDSQEVRAAIESAAGLWSTDPREALRALRLAAEGAADAGDDARSVQLARAAADLRSLANVGNSNAPPPPSMPVQTIPVDPNAVLVTPGVVPAIPALHASAVETPLAVPSAMMSAATSAEAGTAPLTATPVLAVDAGSDAQQFMAPAFAMFGQDPAQTIPATPAAAAAAALQEASIHAVAQGPGIFGQAPDTSMASTWPTGGHRMNAGADAQTMVGQHDFASPNAVVTLMSPAAELNGAGTESGAASDAVASSSSVSNGVNGPAESSVDAAADTPHAGLPGEAPDAPPLSETYAPVSVTPTSIAAGASGAVRMPAGVPSLQGQYGLSAAMAASNPTPVEVPAVRRQLAEAAAKRAAMAAGGARPAGVASSSLLGGVRPSNPVPGVVSPGVVSPGVVSPGVVSPGSVPPDSARFVEHRAVRVAISPVPNAAGHFELHPLSEGELPEAGWREALLVALDASQRLLPGRG